MLEDLLDAVDGIAYAVDAQNRIVAVGRRRWDRFAAETGAPELRADNVVGRNLFDFVSAPDVRQAYQQMADRVGLTGEPVAVAVHYDSPGIARHLRLSIAPLRLEGDRPALLFQAQMIGEAKLPRLDIFDFEAVLSALKQETDLPIVMLCSFCHRLRRPGSEEEEDWITAREYYRHGGTNRVRISHGLCADCDAARFPDV